MASRWIISESQAARPFEYAEKQGKLELLRSAISVINPGGVLVITGVTDERRQHRRHNRHVLPVTTTGAITWYIEYEPLAPCVER